jgi:manganese efflux pump family protein
MLKVVAFVLPLGLDSFAIAAALGATGAIHGRGRWRILAVFVAFEAGMPLVGLGLGAPLAHAIGSVADYLAAVAVIALGSWMLLHGDDPDEERNAGGLVTARGAALIGLGVSISLDELAIGFSVGLARLPAAPVIVAIGIQAFVAAQLGLLLGSRIGARYSEVAERLAAVALIILGVFLVLERLLS